MSHLSSWVKSVNVPKVTFFRWNLNKRNLTWNKYKKSAILTSGGNCPGLNFAIFSIVKESQHETLFVVNGFYGLNNNEFTNVSYSELEHSVDSSGSIIGMSRDRVIEENSIDTLLKNNISNLYIIGGNGSVTAGNKLHNFILEQNLPICVNVLPKTIDNDIIHVHNSFGFDTSVGVCANIINSAYNEAKTNNEISIVELMGRRSGLLSLYSAYSSIHTDILVVPEYDLSHDYLVNNIENVYSRNNYAVVVIAEGSIHSGIELTKTIEKLGISKRPKLFLPNYLCRNSSPSFRDKFLIKNYVKHLVSASELGWGGFTITESGSMNFQLIPLERCAHKTKYISSKEYDLFKMS